MEQARKFPPVSMAPFRLKPIQELIFGSHWSVAKDWSTLEKKVTQHSPKKKKNDISSSADLTSFMSDA